MFRYFTMFDNNTHFGFIGAGFLLVALMIFIFPELVAYFVATMFLWIGMVFVALALRKRPRRRSNGTYHYEEFYEIL